MDRAELTTVSRPEMSAGRIFLADFFCLGFPGNKSNGGDSCLLREHDAKASGAKLGGIGR